MQNQGAPASPSHAETGPRPPTDAETAEREVAPFRHMTAEERLVWFERLQRGMDVFTAGRARVEDPDDADFSRRWRDPNYARPR